MDPDHEQPAKAMDIIHEPAKAMVQCHQVWSNRLDHVNLVYITIYGLQVACHTWPWSHHKRQKHKLESIYKIGYLIHDRIRSCAFPYYVRPCSSSAYLYQSLSYTSSIDKISPWVAPMFPPIDLPWNRFYTASSYKAVLASWSGIRPSPFSPNHLRVSPGCRRSPGRDHTRSNTITGSCITSPFSAHETAFLHTYAFKAVSTIGSGIRPPIFYPGYLGVIYGCRGSLGRGKE